MNYIINFFFFLIILVINSSFMNTFSLQSYCIGKILGIRDAIKENCKYIIFELL